MSDQNLMKEITNFCITRGFIYPNSDIYGGLANTWDFGPLGVEIKKKIKDLWWKEFIQKRLDMVGLDSSILAHPMVWEASGHLSNFSDPLVDCRQCRSRFRADHLVKEQLNKEIESLTQEQLSDIISKEGVYCPTCEAKDFTPIRQFNLMFKTFQGVTEESSSPIYLRPETAQEIFIQWNHILQTTRKKLPFGVGQIGKSFRNEVTPGNFIFRTREFEQMEIEYFTPSDLVDEKFQAWLSDSFDFFTKVLQISEDFLRIRHQEPKELAHYSKMTADIEYLFPFGWGELAGVAHRGCFDLTTHQEKSGEKLEYLDPYTQMRYIPDVIEPSFGVERAFLCLIINSYTKEILEDQKERLLLKLPYYLAPISMAILPLKKSEEKIVALCQYIIKDLTQEYKVSYDETGSIGKLYRRQDEIGTPFCITVDFESLDNKTVTVRNRDTMLQERIAIDNLLTYFKPYFNIKLQ